MITEIISMPKMVKRSYRILGTIFDVYMMDLAEFRFAAIDENGDLIIYKNMPEVGYDTWIDYIDYNQYIATVEFDGSWKDTLIEIELIK